MPGGTVALNADVRGELRMEVLAENGEPLPGYAMDDCYPIRSDGIRQQVHWKHGRRIQELRGKRIQLRFTMQDGDLYSFWFN
jgi:hypothetical protein